MKLLFVHDHRFKKVNEKFYSNGGLDNKTLKRYTDIFGDITIAARIEEIEKTCNYSEITNPNVKIEHTYINLKRIKELIEKHDFIIFRLPSKQGLMAVKYAKKLNKPYLVESVGCPWDAYWNHSLIGKVVAPIMWYLTKKVVWKAPYVTYVSEDFLQRRYPTNGKTLACSDVQLKALNETCLKQRLEKINNRKSEIALGTVAAVNVRYKGQQYVIKAMAKLKKEGYNIKYHLAGGGDNTFLKSVAEKCGVQNDVIFYGSLEHDKVFEFMDNMDVYIQPSLAESHGRVLVEAMSRSCPVIGSTTGGIPELVDSKYVFKRKNVNDICNKIKMIMSGEEMILEAKRSFERAEDFLPEKLESRRKEFYEMFKKESIKND